MQNPSWEDENRSGSQEIHKLLYISKIYYRVHKDPSVKSILSQLNPVQAPR
jgi:hypothetical protein